MQESLAKNQLHVAVDLLILTVRDGRLNLLLTRRVSPPFAGQWALPGRFMASNESAENAAHRLLEETLPVRDAFMEQLYTFTQADRDPRGRVVSVAYLVIVPWGRLRSVPEEKARSFQCFEAGLKQEALCLKDGSGAALSDTELAFDHGCIVKTGIQRLRNKIDYTDIGFYFLEDRAAFSLGDLQTVFEAVLDSRLDTSNFRRFILNRYEKTGRLKQTERIEKRDRGRPAALYRLEE
ncbi:MAG: NUDIX hydrolase [Clostridia bacterium]|nr:NUDIX hydrolase [Clostridia bacterium]